MRVIPHSKKLTKNKNEKIKNKGIPNHIYKLHKIYFSSQTFSKTDRCPPVSYLMLLCVPTLKNVRFKQKYWRHINVTQMAKVLVLITLEAKESLKKHSFIMNFIFYY